jgi:SP family general alpha glucoside:H+ symporter-like MFS transporter
LTSFHGTDKDQVGCILGLIINGYITEWFGYKKTMVISMIVMAGAICIPFFSTSLEMFLIGGIVQGLPWGVFQTLAISYAA